MGHIFISYSHADADFAENLSNKLKDVGFDIWIDYTGLKAGDDWRQGIELAIKEASSCSSHHESRINLLSICHIRVGICLRCRNTGDTYSVSLMRFTS